ncbi:hypothetical protein J2X61_004895 [Bacillus sp. 3255]|nr:hypothetical protein [Bacillus sp. 3255]
MKSVQRGVSSFATESITISAVNVNKAFVKFNNTGNMYTISSGNSVYRCYLLNSTTIRIEQAGTYSSNANFAWEVIEFF